MPIKIQPKLKKLTTVAIIFFLLGYSFQIKGQEKVTISGYIKDNSSGEELIGASVLVQELGSGTTTNIYGYYSISIPKGSYNLIYSYVGFQKIEKHVELTEDTKINIELTSQDEQLEEVLITGQQADQNIKSTDMSTVNLEIESIKKLPAFLGEVDVLKTVQLLPGVSSAGDGNTGFFVRGGAADQNLVLLDEAVVYNASHLFNFFSVFNPDAVKDLKLYKGGIPPQYGGRLSSVLDIRMKEGNMKQYKVNGGIGIISSRLTVEGPLQKEKSSFLISGRRTYADLFLKLSPDEVQRNTQLYFYDLNVKMNYVLNENNRIFLSGYFGRDVTSFQDLFGFDWGNGTGTIRWNHLFSDKLFSNFSLVYSNYQFNIRGDIGPTSFRWKSFINDLNLKADFNYYLNTKNTLSFGIQSAYHNLDPGTIKAQVEGAVDFEERLSQNNGLESGVYLNNEQKLWDDRVSVKYGARVSAYQVIGEGKQYTYDQTDPNAWQVTDTLDLQRGNFYDTYFGFEPRASIRFTVDEKSSIKASYNRMIQYVQQAQSAQSVAPYDVWFTVSNNIKPIIANQIAVGYFRNFFSDKLESSVELYYKELSNIYDIIDNGNVLGNELLESQLRAGRGWSYGAEFLLEKKSGKFSGFVGYTLSWTMRQIEDINDGEAYFAPYDRRNDLSLAGTYDITKRLTLGTNFTYATGRAITLPEGKLSFQGQNAPIYGPRNSSRLPDYHRFDLSLTINPKEREEKSKRKFESSWTFSVFNVYGRVNPISVSFAESSSDPGPRSEFFYIPGPIPSVTWNFNF